MRTRRILLAFLGCFLIYFSSRIPFSFSKGLEKYLAGAPLITGNVKFIPVTLRDGMESLKSPLWPLKNPSEIFSHSIYQRADALANKTGLNLRDHMDKYFISGTKDKNFFLLFYYFVTASGCLNDYVIQRTRLDKEYIDFAGEIYKTEQQYLVETMAIDALKETKTAYEHRREYSLAEVAKRRVRIDVQIGCGQIPGVLETPEWPYGEDRTSYRLEDYANEPGLYNKVKYQFSSTYHFMVEFDQDGLMELDLGLVPR